MKIRPGNSEQLTYVSGSTFIFGITSLNFMSFFPILRQFLTGSTRFRRLYVAMVPDSMEAFETNVTEVFGTNVCRLGSAVRQVYGRDAITANIGRIIIGSTRGIEALGSPCLVVSIVPWISRRRLTICA